MKCELEDLRKESGIKQNHPKKKKKMKAKLEVSQRSRHC